MSGAILWFTGLSGGGKSTLANAVGARLKDVRAVEILDGDEVRTHLSKGLGFSREDRDINVHRIGFVARLLARHGVFVITAAISPYAATRNEIRELATAEGIPFVEAFVNPALRVAGQARRQGVVQAGLGRRDRSLYRGVRPLRSPDPSRCGDRNRRRTCRGECRAAAGCARHQGHCAGRRSPEVLSIAVGGSAVQKAAW